MELFLLYVWTRLDAIGKFLELLCFVVFMGFFATVMFGIIEEPKKIKSVAIYVIPILLILSLTRLAIPSKQDVAIIVAGSGVIQAARSETAQRLASKSVQVIEQALDKYLEKSDAKSK